CQPFVELLRALMDEHEVIHIAAVMPHLEHVLDELIQHVQIDVGAELAHEVADGEPMVSILACQAFAHRYQVQQVRVATHEVPFARVRLDDAMGELMPPRIQYPGIQELEQRGLMDADEEIGDIAFQVEGRTGPIPGAAAGMMLEPLGRAQSAAARYAGEG